MGLTATELISRINKKIHNAKGKLGGDDELYNILNEGNRQLQLKTDLVSAKRDGASVLLFDDTYEYPLPADMDYNKVAEARLETEINDAKRTNFEMTQPKFLFNSRNPFYSSGRYNQEMYNDDDVHQDISTMAVEFEDGQPYLNVRLSGDKGSKATLNSCNTYDGNGTWTGSSDATNVRTDSQRYKEGGGSVAFDSNGGATTVVMTNSDMDAVDLTDYNDKGVVFMWVNLPATMPSSIALKWGSSASAYWSVTATTRYNGLGFVPGWNLIGFAWEGATETGTPTITAVNYLQLTITNSAATALTGYRIDFFQVKTGVELNLKYYSKYLLKNSSGTRQEEFSDSDDETILAHEEVDMLICLAAQLALENLREDKEAMVKEKQLKDMLEIYEQKFPSDKDIESYNYYNL